MSHGHFVRALREFGVVGTWKKLYKMRTIKFGTLVGTDKYGNQYFENTTDYAHGQHRWVEYAGEKNFYEVDASYVPAEWHGWLHGSTEEAPTETTTGSTWRTLPIANGHDVHSIYKRNLGGVITPHLPNMSSRKPRGYGLGNGINSEPGEEGFYTQPGHPLDKRNPTRRVPRASRLGFTLRDTPATLTAKAAVRAGLTAAEYDKFTNAAHPTRTLLMITSGEITAEGREAIEATGNPVLAEAVAGMPTEPAKRELAVRLAAGTGHARPWSPEVERGTFAAARAEVLSREEEDFLAGGWDEDQLLARVEQYDGYIQSYQASRVPAAVAGVARSRQLRDEAQANLGKLRTIQAKLAALQAKFDERAVAQVAAAAAGAR